MPCKIDGCSKPGEYIRDMCPMHYQRWRLRGDPLWEPKQTTLEERFWAKVQKSDDCWTWTAAMFVDGYGVFSGEQKQTRAHRFSWELQHGPIPDGLSVLHRCDNRACVRPDHLFLGTHEDNMADMDAKGRRHMGERHYATNLTEDDVRQIRAAVRRGERHDDIAKRYGICRPNVSMIASGKTWRHVVDA